MINDKRFCVKDLNEMNNFKKKDKNRTMKFFPTQHLTACQQQFKMVAE